MTPLTKPKPSPAWPAIPHDRGPASRARRDRLEGNRPLMGRRLEHQVHEGQQSYFFLDERSFSSESGLFQIFVLVPAEAVVERIDVARRQNSWQQVAQPGVRRVVQGVQDRWCGLGPRRSCRRPLHLMRRGPRPSREYVFCSGACRRPTRSSKVIELLGRRLRVALPVSL